MRGRKPNKAESIFGKAVINAVGCVACAKLGYDNDYPEPAEYVQFHHNPDKGSIKPHCHFFGYGLCPVHHQGTTPGGQKIPEGEPVRHSPLGSHYTAFKEKVGTDLDNARYVWDRLPLEAQDQIGELTGIWDFDELLKEDAKLRNY
ncbi:TPA: hypothetical protein P0E36_004885 [Vibrio harveyi]|nr:hypothetical protein [Vibrio harveyi]